MGRQVMQRHTAKGDLPALKRRAGRTRRRAGSQLRFVSIASRGGRTGYSARRDAVLRVLALADVALLQVAVEQLPEVRLRDGNRRVDVGLLRALPFLTTLFVFGVWPFGSPLIRMSSLPKASSR